MTFNICLKKNEKQMIHGYQIEVAMRSSGAGVMDGLFP